MKKFLNLLKRRILSIYLLKGFGLDDKYKSRLIEILLIIGGILGAFQLGAIMLPFFIIFLISSVLYYISIHSQNGKKRFYWSSSTFVSLTFSGVVSSILGTALVEFYGTYIAYIISIIYYGFFAFILYLALYK